SVTALVGAVPALDLPTTRVPTVISQQADVAQTTTLSPVDLSTDAIPAHLQYVATPDGVALTWDYVLKTPDGEHWYNLSVDGMTGQLRDNFDWVDRASYNVFPLPNIGEPDDTVPALTRSLLTDPNDTTFSPFGWHDTDGVAGPEFTDTRGNNVFAQDGNGNR